MSTAAARLRALLRADQMVVAPGAFDGITAQLVMQFGFPAVYMTGAGTAFSHGFPDLGLITLTEMADNAGRMASSVNVPVIADADTGYGNQLNVTRTVREYERRGVAAIHIEDQVAPKRCGHQEGKEIVPAAEFVAKIRTAVAARQSADFMVIARTDARAVEGFDSAIERANLALAAGADMAFVEAMETLDEVAAVPKLVKGPCLLNIVRGGKTPDVDLRTVQELGYRLAILPSLLLFAVVEASDAVLSQLRETGQPPSSAGRKSLRELLTRFGTDDWEALRTRFAPEDQRR